MTRPCANLARYQSRPVPNGRHRKWRKIWGLSSHLTLIKATIINSLVARPWRNGRRSGLENRNLPGCEGSTPSGRTTKLPRGCNYGRNEQDAKERTEANRRAGSPASRTCGVHGDDDWPHFRSGVAIALLQHDGDEPTSPDGEKAGRGEAKTLLLDLLREAGTTGLNAAIAEQLAKHRGAILKRGTAASNLAA